MKVQAYFLPILKTHIKTFPETTPLISLFTLNIIYSEYLLFLNKVTCELLSYQGYFDYWRSHKTHISL